MPQRLKDVSTFIQPIPIRSVQIHQHQIEILVGLFLFSFCIERSDKTNQLLSGNVVIDTEAMSH
ncbi:MAG: hypothetical protein CMJ46_10185 [Planctomyces sp.]|nr:hypothetical protein [Planctomyces sp.]